ncbi:MAG: cytochrome c biogenesis protein CcsA [Planctomycetes bacterium]|nr:cytochrome c biogenesis protein CcsA [Planctomycetota bacterium]
MSQLALILASLQLLTTQPAESKLSAALDLDTIRALPVQHDGRWPPLDTVARDLVETITGEMFYRGHDPVLLLLAWTFDSPTWMREPLIAIQNAELRAELRLPAAQPAFSYVELIAHRPLHDLADELALVEDRKLNPLESKVNDINEKLILLQRIFAGQVIRPVPHPESVVGAWRTIEPAPPHGADDLAAIRTAWSALRAAFLASDPPGFAAAAQQLAAAQRALPAAQRPTAELIATELRYNWLRPRRAAWMMMVVGALLAVVALLVRRGWCDGLAIAAMVAGFALLTYGLSMRWAIAGRIPAANMFESLLFLSWGMGAFAIVAMFVQRQRIVPLTASAMGAVALILADCLPLDHFVRPIAPVLLDTIWMSIHVPIIMVSYSVLALAVLIAHAQLVVMAAAPERRELAVAIDTLHYWYVQVGALFLAAGIITGSMWAASSWGRYWGWDPKEVWSLVAFLGYMAILHARLERGRVTWWMYVVAALLTAGLFALVVPKLAPLSGLRLAALGSTAVAIAIFVLARGAFATALKSVLAFWLIIMTYVGVNYVLGVGLHSYGFGTGAVVRYMFLIGAIDSALVALCCVVYLARRSWRRPSAADRQPVASPA